MDIINLPCVFGENSKCKCTLDNGITIKLDGDFLYSKTQYKYQEPTNEDELLGMTEKICDEESVISKSTVKAVGYAYSNEDGCYYLMIEAGQHHWVNVDSKQIAITIYNQIKNWWLCK